ncbi:MAG: VCBS repeat-containing protein [Candidatus Eisenbacteria bacterium]|nr:VCBS repeat-containing protein [Candidatus Eisenbacteria bacterium]
MLRNFRASLTPIDSTRIVRRQLPAVCTLALLGLASTPTGPAVAAMSWTKVTDASNPIVTDQGADSQKYYGASWIDYDGDGDIDLFVDQDLLYRNDGAGVFTKILTSGLGSLKTTTQPFSMEGQSWADVDNDGDLDAFLSGEVGYLYRNAAGLFTPVQSGAIGTGLDNRGWACTWADYDNDGFVDLMITLPDGFIPGPTSSNHLFHNDGPPNWTFTRVTSEPITSEIAPFTVATWADYDDDGDQDLFIGSGPANGTVIPDYLYRNLLTETGTANFERILDAPIGTDLQDGQVWNWIDYDNDGDLDAYLTNYAGTSGTGMANRLYRHESDGSFTPITGQPIVLDADPSLASTWGDLDNDGDLDCFVATDGSVRDRIYENNNDGTFTSIFTTPLSGVAFATRSATLGDYDDDGDLDLFVNAPTIRRSLYRNETTGNHWLKATLVGTVSNRAAIGARVRIKATIWGQPVWQRRDVSAQNQFQGQNDLRQHFGLGDAAVIDSLIVDWPSGRQSILTGVARDQHITLAEPTSASLETTEARQVGRPVLLGSWPAPFAEGTQVRLRLHSDAPAVLAVHDATGREQRRIVLTSAAGDQVVTWDGRDARGAELPGGVYWLRLESAGRSDRLQVVRIR